MLGKHCQTTVETSQPPLNVLPVFFITEQKVYNPFACNDAACSIYTLQHFSENTYFTYQLAIFKSAFK